MNNNDFLCTLLDCLDDPSVASKILSIANQTHENTNFKTNLEQIERDYNALKNLLDTTKEQLKITENQVLAKTNQLNEQSEQLNIANLELSNIKTELEASNFNCKNLESHLLQEKNRQHMFEKYMQLSEYAKNGLKGVFKQDDFENFISCGCQKSNIDTVWEFAKNLILSNKTEDLIDINDILTYFINLYNNISQKPTFSIQNVNINDVFDTSLHLKTQDSKSSGKISQICLIGYENATNQKIINKTIVKVD